MKSKCSLFSDIPGKEEDMYYENKDIGNEGKSIRGKTLQSCCEKERETGKEIKQNLAP